MCHLLAESFKAICSSVRQVLFPVITAFDTAQKIKLFFSHLSQKEFAMAVRKNN